MVEQHAWTPKLTLYKADLYTTHVPCSINVGYPRLKPTQVIHHYIAPCHIDLLIQAFDSLQISAAGSVFCCRHTSSLLKHPTL